MPFLAMLARLLRSGPALLIDSELLAREFGGGYTADSFSGLANYEVLAKVLFQSESLEPSRGHSVPVFGFADTSRGETLKSFSRKCGRKRDLVEDNIRRWLRTK